MIVTREMDYALRILRALHRSGQLSATAVGEQEHMQRSITLKVLKQLHAAGLVESRRGVTGGYALARPARELTMYDVFAAMNERVLVNRCQEERYRCENYPDGGCNICQELFRIQRVLDSELKRTPLSDMF